jgi:hypothetical protein
MTSLCTIPKTIANLGYKQQATIPAPCIIFEGFLQIA